MSYKQASSNKYADYLENGDMTKIAGDPARKKKHEIRARVGSTITDGPQAQEGSLQLNSSKTKDRHINFEKVQDQTQKNDTLDYDELDQEVERITGKVKDEPSSEPTQFPSIPPGQIEQSPEKKEGPLAAANTARGPPPANKSAGLTIQMKDNNAALGDGVDFAAAGVKDLNNFKGYHNQEGNNEEADRYLDPKTGAHFDFKNMCDRLLKIFKNKEQEKKLFQLTGIRETLDQSFYGGQPTNHFYEFKPNNLSPMKQQSEPPIGSNRVHEIGYQIMNRHQQQQQHSIFENQILSKFGYSNKHINILEEQRKAGSVMQQYNPITLMNKTNAGLFGHTLSNNLNNRTSAYLPQKQNSPNLAQNEQGQGSEQAMQTLHRFPALAQYHYYANEGGSPQSNQFRTNNPLSSLGSHLPAGSPHQKKQQHLQPLGGNSQTISGFGSGGALSNRQTNKRTINQISQIIGQPAPGASGLSTTGHQISQQYQPHLQTQEMLHQMQQTLRHNDGRFSQRTMGGKPHLQTLEPISKIQQIEAQNKRRSQNALLSGPTFGGDNQGTIVNAARGRNQSKHFFGTIQGPAEINENRSAQAIPTKAMVGGPPLGHTSDPLQSAGSLKPPGVARKNIFEQPHSTKAQKISLNQINLASNQTIGKQPVVSKMGQQSYYKLNLQQKRLLNNSVIVSGSGGGASAPEPNHIQGGAGNIEDGLHHPARAHSSLGNYASTNTSNFTQTQSNLLHIHEPMEGHTISAFESPTKRAAPQVLRAGRNTQLKMATIVGGGNTLKGRAAHDANTNMLHSQTYYEDMANVIQNHRIQKQMNRNRNFINNSELGSYAIHGTKKNLSPINQQQILGGPGKRSPGGQMAGTMMTGGLSGLTGTKLNFQNKGRP